MKKGLKKLLGAVLAAILLCGAALPASAAMTDIGGHWAAPAIQYCLDNGYMNGMSATSFQPNAPVDRAMVVQVLYNISGKPDVSGLTNPFDDSRTHWAGDAIKWGSSTGVVQGLSSTKFGPTDKVTRAQAATMFMRYANQDSSNIHNDFTVDTSVLSLYPDRGQIASWYEEGVAWAVQYGFMQGSGGRLDPAGSLTRAQLAQFIKNYFEPLEGVQPPAPSDKFPTVADFLADPAINAELREMIDSLEDVKIDLRGDEDTLYYDFYFLQGQLDGVDLEQLAASLENKLSEESFAQVFVGIAQAITEVVDVDNPKVVLSYYTYEGSLIFGMEYSAY